MAATETHIALLYSVVLAPGRRVIMADLTAMARDLEFENPRTLLATGNLIFETKDSTVSAIEKKLEAEFTVRFGREVSVIVRTAEEWQHLYKSNPFTREAETDASHLIVRVNRNPVPRDAEDILTPYIANGEKLVVADREIWVHFAKDIGSSRLGAAMTPKRLGIGTSRNWNTVQKIAAALEQR